MVSSTYQNLEELLKNRIFFHFSEISKIPRQTFFEKEISNFILNWAKNLNLEVSQDKNFNLLIRKPASKGYENKKAIILQSHIDMVCEKSPNSNHDFKKDPIKFYLDGDIISTHNTTTLGADDGIGVALAMTILEDTSLKHPAIDVIFTTAEEEDMSGALNVDKSWLHTNRLINIDHIIDNEIISGSCGGKGVEFKFKTNFIETPESNISYKICVKGLIGGHSGEDINKGRGNANIILARFLYELRKNFDFLISDIKGGSFRLAIPRESEIVLNFSQDNLEKFKSLLKNFEKDIKKVYEGSDKNLNITFENTALHKKSLSTENRDKIIDSLLLLPNGVAEMIGDLNVVETSCNLGEVYLKDEYLHIIAEIRSSFEFNREYLYKKFELIAQYLNAELNYFSAYPSWEYSSNSPLRDTAEKVYSELFGEKVKVLALHAGLECGCFAPKIENMDAISIGPNTWDLHSPKERLSVSSTDKIYKFLTKILENLD